jgi:superfamily II DNA/RNA helicase
MRSHLRCAAAVAAGPVAVAQRRGIIVPKQLKAHAQEFNPSKGERSTHMMPHRVLQKTKDIGARRNKVTTDFAEMPLPLPIRDALAEMGVSVPSPVQQSAIVPVLQRESVLIASQSGTGKTLAALAPMYTLMSKDRDVYNVPLRENRPRAFILAPTQELCEQIHAVCKQLDATTGLKSMCFTGSGPRVHHRWKMMARRGMPDVLVMHPAMVLRLVENHRLFLDDLRHVMVDEADALVGQGHGYKANKLLAMVNRRACYKHLWPVATQSLFVTAGVTRQLTAYVEKKHRGAVSVVTQGTHVAPLLAKQKFHKVSAESEKMDLLKYLLLKGGNRAVTWAGDEGEQRQQHEWLQLPPPAVRPAAASVASAAPDGETSSGALMVQDEEAAADVAEAAKLRAHRPAKIVWENLTTTSAPFTTAQPRVVAEPGQRVMVFFRSIDRATAVYHQLHRAGHKVAVLHGSLPADVRREMWARWSSGQCNVLCCTDIVGRGVDCPVDCVVNFDTPTNPIEYINRAGRTARMGRRGVVHSLYSKKQRTIVAVLRQFVKGGIALEGVSNWYAHMTRPRYGEWSKHSQDKTARNYVKLITTKTIPKHLERTYLRHQATWRPPYHPRTIGIHGGVAPTQQQKISDKVRGSAVEYRKQQLARKKGGKAKFGGDRNATWVHKGAATTMHAGFGANSAGAPPGER